VQDRFELTRFLEAQDSDYQAILAELTRGRKRGHWMWYVFPQLRGLGSSTMSDFYGISSLEEARAYWSHPVLGARLEECTRAVVNVKGRSAEEVFGAIDALKFRSCLTLFQRAAPEAAIFAWALQQYFGGEADQLTSRLLEVGS
jgi:uncharacterized protein (DUF1810 family)